jgi:hypothetical protein
MSYQNRGSCGIVWTGTLVDFALQILTITYTF